MLHPNGLVGNFIHLRIDSDIYRVTESYLVDINISNLNAALYPPIIFIGNLHSFVVMQGLISIDSNSVVAIISHQLYNRVEMSDFYVETTDALATFIFEVSFINEIIVDNITINNNDIASNDPTGIFYFNPFSGGVLNLSNINIINSNIGAKHAIEYRQSGTGIANIQNLYVENVTLGIDTKIIKTQSLLTIYLKNGTFIAVKPQDLGDSTPKLVDLVNNSTN